MLNIKRFVCNAFQENCYVVNDDTNDCVIIDCGASYDEERKAIADYIRGNGLTVSHLLCTHGHLDHNFGDDFIFNEFGVKPEISRDDEQLLGNLRAQAKAFTGIDYSISSPSIGGYIADGDTVTFGSHRLKVISTPGHTHGSVFFHCEEESLAFSGDTLFQLSVGRTDLQEGNHEMLMASLKKIVGILPHETMILPGHGPHTNIKDEVTYNPYIKTALGRWE